jgi:hypothetical protein
MEEEIYTLLSGAVSFPVAWGGLGKGATLPRAAIQRVSAVRDMHLDGTGLIEGRIQVDCYGETFGEAITAARGIRTALEGYRGGLILGVFLDSTRDGQDDDAGLLQRVSMTFSITYRD